MAAKTRKFNGETYRLHPVSFQYKGQATHMASKLRRERGIKARVAQVGPGDWGVYTRSR